MAPALRSQQEEHTEILFSNPSRHNIFLYFITPMRKSGQSLCAGNMPCYHLGLWLAQNITVFKVFCRKANI